MHDVNLYDEISGDVFADYSCFYPDDEITNVRYFLDKINRGAINNKKDARGEFKKLKEKINNQNLRD